MMTTVKPAPATRTRTSASPGPMERTGTSSRRSAPPSWRSTIAFIRRGALTPTTPLKPGRAPPRLQNTSARGPPTRCCDWLEVVRVEAADQIGMAVDGEVVVDVRDRAAAGGHAEDAALDEDYLAAGRAGRRPGEHRVLEDHAAAEIAELAEVRVVDLDEEPEVPADVPIERQTQRCDPEGDDRRRPAERKQAKPPESDHPRRGRVEGQLHRARPGPQERLQEH